jgi:hypothetical protein
MRSLSFSDVQELELYRREGIVIGGVWHAKNAIEVEPDRSTVMVE